MNEQDEALLLDYVEGELKGVELERAQAMLAADATLAAGVEAMRADRAGLRALGEAALPIGAAQTGPLPDAVQAALAKWNGNAASTPTNAPSTAGFVGPSPVDEEPPSENHVWQPKKHRRVWHVELIVAYGGIAAMLVVGALAVLSPDNDVRPEHDFSDRMPSMSMASDGGSRSAPMMMEKQRADGPAATLKDADEQRSDRLRVGGDTGRTALAARTSGRDAMLADVKTHGDASPAAATPAAPNAAVAAAPAMPAAEPAQNAGKLADSQLALGGKSRKEAANADVVEVKKEKAAAPMPAPREVQYDKDGREMSPARAAAAADRIAAREAANARALSTPMAQTALAAGGPSGSLDDSKQDATIEPAEVLVDTVSAEVAMKIVSDWAKTRQIPIERISHKTVSRAGKAAEKPAAGAKAPEASADRITIVLTTAELSDLLLRLNGARETSARLDSAPLAVKGYVTAMLARPSVAYSVADLSEENGAGAQKPEDKQDEEAKKPKEAKEAKEAAASQPDKTSTQASHAGVEAPRSVRTAITFRESKSKK